MRFKTVVLKNNDKIQNLTETIKRGLQNSSMTAEEVIKNTDKILELTEVNSQLLEREYEPETV